MFTKILIANRGEIACRIIRTARRLGIATVAVYSDADAGSLHRRQADEAVRIGGAAARDSYLKGDAIIDAALSTGAQAIHPGYGFLSENEAFASACAAAGLVFIGPSPQAINAMGLKDRAKAIMAAAGVPVVPGYLGAHQAPELLEAEADRIGYPVLIKAVAGGGGKGMRRVDRATDFAAALASCQREAESAFGNSQVLIEKYILRPRHVEMQVFGDSHGNTVHLFERDCSLQRRHQKVIEEAPAPGLPEAVRQRLGAAAVQAVRAIGYTNAGTIEFIMDSVSHDFYFMEMNTRLQVEHPVTEMITGLDLVEWQLRVAAGEALPLKQDQIVARGHAFEARLYAEDPAQGFLPQTGRIAALVIPPAARVDTGITAGDAVTIFYDPMIAKIICHGADRLAALKSMRSALANTAIVGLRTNQEFLANIFADDDFAAAAIDTDFIPRHEEALLPADYGLPRPADWAAAAIFLMAGASAVTGSSGPWDAGDNWRAGDSLARSFSLTHRGGTASLHVQMIGGTFTIAVEGRRISASLLCVEGGRLELVADGTVVSVLVARDADALYIFNGGRAVRLWETPRRFGVAKENGRIVSPMPGRIVAVNVGIGDHVDSNAALLVMEAMKMEMTIRAPSAGVIESLNVGAGDQVADGAVLATLAPVAAQ